MYNPNGVVFENKWFNSKYATHRGSKNHEKNGYVRQCTGSKDPNVFKTNQSHDDIFRLFFIELKNIL